MKFVVQRVTEASVEVEHKIVGKIEKGYLVFLGVGQGDTEEIADRYLKKLLGLRIFEDENGKTNLSEGCGRGTASCVTVYPLCQL